MEVDSNNTVSVKEIEEKVEESKEEKKEEEAPHFPALSAQEMAVWCWGFLWQLGKRGDSPDPLPS